MLKHIRNRETGKYEFREVSIPLLNSKVLELETGDYEFRRRTGFNRVKVAQQDKLVVVTSGYSSYYFSKQGDLNMVVKHAFGGIEAQRLNLNFEENLDTAISVIKMLNNIETQIFME